MTFTKMLYIAVIKPKVKFYSEYASMYSQNRSSILYWLNMKHNYKKSLKLMLLAKDWKIQRRSE